MKIVCKTKTLNGSIIYIDEKCVEKRTLRSRLHEIFWLKLLLLLLFYEYNMQHANMYVVPPTLSNLLLLSVEHSN